MKIWIDGDGCPVKKEVISVAARWSIPVASVVDINHQVKEQGVEVVTVDQGTDSADMAILSRMQAKEVVVTGDMGLASLVIAKKGYVMDPNGQEINSMNIDLRLFERHLSREIRMKKGRHKGPKPRSKEANGQFKEAFAKFLKTIQDL